MLLLACLVGLRAAAGRVRVVRVGALRARRGALTATSRYGMSLVSTHTHTHYLPVILTVISINTYHVPTPYAHYNQVCDERSHALFFPTQQHVVGLMSAPAPGAGDSAASVRARPAFATPSSALRGKLSEHSTRFIYSDDIACDTSDASASATASASAGTTQGAVCDTHVQSSHASSHAAKYGAAVSIGLLDTVEGADFLSFRSLWSAQGLQDEVICT